MKKMISRCFLALLVMGVLCSGAVVPAQAARGDGNRVHKEYYDNGHLRLYLKFRDDLIVRKKAYYRNGQVKLDHEYRNGRAVRIRNYYEDGRLFSRWTVKEGVTKYYNRDGTLRTAVELPSE